MYKKWSFCFLYSLLFSTVTFASHPLSFNPQLSQRLLHRKAPLLNPKVLQLALTAYGCAQKRGLHPKPELAIVDFSLASTTKRLWVINLNSNRVDFKEMVTHASNSGYVKPTRFSNRPQSHQSSYGVFLAGNSYYGQHGYAMRVKGLERGINNNAFKRAIVFHSAPYATPQFARRYGYLGRSWGCFALNPQKNKPTINSLRNGGLVFVYYPNNYWLHHSAYLHC